MSFDYVATQATVNIARRKSGSAPRCAPPPFRSPKHKQHKPYHIISQPRAPPFLSPASDAPLCSLRQHRRGRGTRRAGLRSVRKLGSRELRIPGCLPMDLGIPPLELKNMLESKP